MSTSKLTGTPVLPSDPLQLDHVPLWDIYHQLGINFGDRVFARIMDGDDEDAPLVNITYKKLYIDSLKVAQVLRERLGDEGKMTYAMLGVNSTYSYFVNIVAGWLNHWTVLLLSSRNSVAGHVSLLKAVDAKVLIADAKSRKTAEAVLQEIQITLLDVVNPEDIATDIDLSQSTIKVEPASQDVFEQVPLYLHSSGTSGHPKPIPQTHEHIVTDTIAVRTNISYVGAPVYAPLPLYHGIGLYCFTRWPMGAGHIPTFVHTKLPMTSASLLRHLRRLPGALCFLAPMLIEDALREPSVDYDVLKTTKRIFVGGAALNRALGKQLIEMGVPIVQVYGSTEISMPVFTDFPGPPETRAEDVPYVRLRDDQFVLHWKPFNDKLSELIVSKKITAPAVLNHRDPIGFATNDLWERHPTIPGLFLHRGRKDSVTVLSNGEKTDNRQIELTLLDDPLIDGVIVFGTGRPLNGILVRQDPKTPLFPSKSAFIDAIWSSIEYLNTIIPQHSRIIREMIVVADSETKPFVLSDKGSIKTKDTITLYQDEIDTAYTALEVEVNEEMVKDIETPQQIHQYVRAVLSKVAKRFVGDTDDFFDSGLDSLHAVQIRSDIKPLFAKFAKGEEPGHNVAYEYPTISQLSEYLIVRSKGEVISNNDSAAVTSRIEACVDRWTAALPERQGSAITVPEKKTFAITGGTGSLGVHLLRCLLERDDVVKVYCLHRGPSDMATKKQTKLFRDRSLPVELLNSVKVTFMQIDISKSDLGLSTEKYDELRGSLTHIIHTAWELNFNWGLERFEKVHIAGVRNLINLSCASTLSISPRIVFMSSIGVVSRHDPEIPVPEEPLPNLTLIGPGGYAEAKYVCERLLDEAARKSGIPITVIRSGQIAGSSVDGYWAPTEYIPTIFKSSKILGKMPNKLPDTRWLPADYCGKAVMDLSLQDHNLVQYYNLENPTTTLWSTVTSLFIKISSTKIEQIDTKEWLVAVEKAHREGRDIPAAALLEFYSSYSGMGSRVRLSTDKAVRASKAIEYGPVTSELMSRYISWI